MPRKATVLVFAFWSLVSGSAVAQGYPERPVRIVVPSPAGGSADLVARIFSSPFSAELRQSVVIENYPGAGTKLGTNLVRSAAPDGYTLLMSPQGVIPGLDLASVALIATSSMVLIAPPSFPAKTLQEFISMNRQGSLPITFGLAGGEGSTSYYAAQLFKSVAKVTANDAPVKSGNAMVDLASGQVSAAFVYPWVALPLIRTGQIRALAVSGHQRIPELKDVPTAQEAGVSGFELSAWFGLFVPKATPSSIQTRLWDAATKALGDSELRRRFLEQGMEPGKLVGPDADAYVRGEFQRTTVVRVVPVCCVSSACGDMRICQREIRQ